MVNAQQQALTRRLHEAGFTVIELLVVLAMMGVLAGLVVANHAAQRVPRDLKIAQVGLMSNLRKIQSYTLSARNISDVRAAQYYVLKFDTATPKQYTLQALYDVTSSPKFVTLETVRLPEGIRLAVTDPIVVSRPVGATPVRPSCALVAFKLPYARTFVSEGCTGTEPDIVAGDSYRKIVDFVANSVSNPVTTDSTVTFTLSDETGALTRSVRVSAATGVISVP